MFCDELKIKVIAGKGGKGCVSFRREKFIPRGGPDGGDGGNGGDIIIKVNRNLNTLGHLAHQKLYRAEDGEMGMGKNMHGKNAEDMTIEVPPGTMIFEINKDKKSHLLYDLENEGAKAVLAHGGKGGMGNTRFKSSTHQVPRIAELGEPGEEKEVILELKLVADVGIIGLPSAGKSTLISVISNAKPKIAAYHFTTLIPNLGVVNMSKFGGSTAQSFVVADIPGLIAGASQGKGLGIQFLKHIARTKILVHLIDGSLPKPLATYKTVISELKKFDKTLPEREEIVVVNKVDLLTPKEITKIETALKKSPRIKKVFFISGVTHEGLKELVFHIYKEYEKQRAKEKAQISSQKESKHLPIIRPVIDRERFKIKKLTNKKENNVYELSGHRIEQLAIMTEMSSPEGKERIYRYLDKSGMKKKLEKEGIRLGDTIKIKEKSLPYRR